MAAYSLTLVKFSRPGIHPGISFTAPTKMEKTNTDKTAMNYTDDTRIQIGNVKLISWTFLAGALLISSIPIVPAHYLSFFGAGFGCLTVAGLGLGLRRLSYRRLLLEKCWKTPSYRG